MTFGEFDGKLLELGDKAAAWAYHEFGLRMEVAEYYSAQFAYVAMFMWGVIEKQWVLCALCVVFMTFIGFGRTRFKNASTKQRNSWVMVRRHNLFARGVRYMPPFLMTASILSRTDSFTPGLILAHSMFGVSWWASSLFEPEEPRRRKEAKVKASDLAWMPT